MDKNYYKEYYQYERNHWFFRARNKIIMSFIKKLYGDKGNKNLKILNVGVATGFTSVLLKDFGEVTSIEYDSECYAFTKENVKDIGLEQGSILDLRFDDESFDLVCAFDVIEHVEDDKKGVSELERVCKSDGKIVITVPAFMSLWSHHDVINHHFRRYHKKELMNVFSKGDNITFCGYFNTWLFIPVFLFRKINNLLNLTSSKIDESDVGSDLQMFNKESFVSKLLYSIFSSESKLINRKFQMPFGISLLVSFEKK